MFNKVTSRLISNLISTPVGHQPSSDLQKLAALSKLFNLDHLRKIVSDGRHTLQPKDPANRLSELGLLSIAAYTSAGLDGMIRDTYSTGGGHKPRRDTVKMLEQVILDTLTQIKPTPANLVKRNLLLTPDLVRQQYKPGATMQFSRITSVTLQPHQVYRGGNVDLSIEPGPSVVDVSGLSVYTNHSASSEREALLNPHALYQVIDMKMGKEPSPIQSQVKHQEEWSILLRYCGEANSNTHQEQSAPKY